jgi:hypothetical protein
MDTFTHFYSVLKDKAAPEEEQKEEKSSENNTKASMLKVGAANVFTGAIGINSIGKDRQNAVLGGQNDAASQKVIE